MKKFVVSQTAPQPHLIKPRVQYFCSVFEYYIALLSTTLHKTPQEIRSMGISDFFLMLDFCEYQNQYSTQMQLLNSKIK